MEGDAIKKTPESENVPIEFSLSTQNIEGSHYIRIVAEPDSTDIRWSLRKLLFGDKIIKDQIFNVRYPNIEMDYEETQSNNLKKISDIHLKNKDLIFVYNRELAKPLKFRAVVDSSKKN